jgi:rhodanese-related sulfurtransferase
MLLISAARRAAFVLMLAAGAAAALPRPVIAEQVDGQAALNRYEGELARRFDGISHVTAEQVEALKSAGRALLVDTRPAREFAVGHVPGAMQIDPGSTLPEVAARLSPLVAGRTVVLYCSVGYRSSRAVGRWRDLLLQAGADAVVNLRGGAFAWHNTGRPLVNASGATLHVHPYSRAWQSYLEFDNLARMRP